MRDFFFDSLLFFEVETQIHDDSLGKSDERDQLRDRFVESVIGVARNLERRRPGERGEMEKGPLGSSVEGLVLEWKCALLTLGHYPE